MPSLAELQTQMAAAILGGAPVPAPVRADGIAVAERIAVYRGNTLGNLTDVLADAFPVVCQLVGDGFFAGAAASFIRGAPPVAPCLAEYGAGFADFLAGFAPAAGLPYLPDVARLDWAVHRAFHAADAAPLDPARLAGLAGDGLRLLPHPSVRLVASRYPVDAIWRAHHGDGVLADVDLGAGCQVLVDRADTAIRLLPLDDGGHAFVAAVLDGEPLVAALAAAAARDPGLDVAALLARHLRRGTFADAIR